MKTKNTSGSRPEPVKLPQKILVPIDFSDCSRHALQYALTYARKFESEITLLAVIPDYHTCYEYGELEMIAVQEKLNQQWQRDLGKLAEEQFHGFRHQAIVRTGKPFEEIVRAAEDINADLIIISTHGYPGATRVELGSTAERVVRHATCPVLVVRQPT